MDVERGLTESREAEEARQDASEAERVQAVIQEMVRRIVEGFHPDKVILFGSHARGEAGPDSDVDLMVVMPVEGSRRRKAVEIGAALGVTGVPKDILVITPADATRYRSIVGTIIRPAFLEGKVLYERAA